MKIRTWLLSSVCLLAGAGCWNCRDRARLSANPWVVEAMKQDGQTRSEHFEIVFAPSGNSVRIITGDKVHKGVFELRSDKDLKEIDIKPDASNLEDAPLYGIYSLDADGQGLVLCLSATKRPAAFEAKEGSDWLLIRLRRE